MFGAARIRGVPSGLRRRGGAEQHDVVRHFDLRSAVILDHER